MNQMLTWLALGDSYTIGEGCPIHDSYPYQALQLLRNEGFQLNAPEIIAKTGFTSSELQFQLSRTSLSADYTIASLLIGVNNQYRGESIGQYAIEFKDLLHQAIKKTNDREDRVFVLSIPDWGLTPFAEHRDRDLITREIAAFNAVNKKIAASAGVHYIDITTSSPEGSADASYLSSDRLHPSGKAYSRWAKLLTTSIISAFEDD